SLTVGDSRRLTFSIANSGNATLNVTGITASGASAGKDLAISPQTGTVASGSSLIVGVTLAPTAMQPYSATLTVISDATSGSGAIGLTGTGIPAGPKTSFADGKFIVGTNIAPGRYFSGPPSGCYWERESGLGGTFGEIISNDFIGFNAGQWIVDV